MSQRTGTFEQFKEYTLAIARGEQRVHPTEPKTWHEPTEGDSGVEQAANAPSHYLRSALRERIVEHVFIGEVLRSLWKAGATDVDVLRPEVDVGGYDLVMSYRHIVRHIQFKSTVEGGKAAGVSVSTKLKERPSGCVVWVVVSQGLDLKSYRWFGSPPGQPLPDISDLKVVKHTKANAQGVKLARPGHRVVPVSRFEKLKTLDAVLERLFGILT